MIDFEMKHPWICPLEELRDDVLFELPSVSNFNSFHTNNPNLEFKKEPLAFEGYASQFSQVQKELNYGNSFLINLTAKNKVETNATLKELFFLSKAKYKLYFKNQFIVFSPETFIKIENGLIKTYPMKGTIDASIPNAKDLILQSSKEKAEHNTIVDLLRNDLSRVSKKVSVNKFRYLDLIENNQGKLYQVSSEIVGELDSNYASNFGSIMLELLPAGSVSGAPKKKTLEIISSVEKRERGYYTGVAGVFDGVNLDTFVMIRFISNENGGTYYHSGGGITSLSQCKDEYEEMIKKIYVPIY